jgi:carbon monoxide dehydrogenase subunit G
VEKLNGFQAHLVYEDESGQTVSGGRIDVSILRKPTKVQLANSAKVIENTGKIFFNGKGSFTEVRYEIVVEMEQGQLFKVNDCSEDSFEYKLKRVRKIFRGKEITVKKRVIQTHHYEAVIGRCSSR